MTASAPLIKAARAAGSEASPATGVTPDATGMASGLRAMAVTA